MSDFTLGRRTALGGGLAAVLLSACNQRPEPSETVSADLPFPPEPTRDAVNLAAAATAFGETLVEHLRAATPTATVLTSPLTNLTALAMLGQGARGRTAAEIAKVLQLEANGLQLDAVGKAYTSMRACLAETPNMWAARPATVRLANSLWFDRRAGLKPAFARTQSEAFAARVESADFADRALPGKINSFVDQTTRGMIPGVVSEFEPEDRLALVSAAYFKAGWDTPFKRSDTRDEPFTQADGTTVTAPLMRKEHYFAYFESSALQAVALGYGDRRFDMVLVLPKRGALPASWATAALDGIKALTAYAPGEVIVPRLDLSWGSDLIPTLRSAGLNETLGPSPDFSGAAPTQLVVSQFAHKTRLLMDEKGTEAAAVTSTDAAADAEEPPPPPPPFVFRADRPFGLILRETKSSAPLFMGYIATPQSAATI